MSFSLIQYHQASPKLPAQTQRGYIPFHSHLWQKVLQHLVHTYMKESLSSTVQSRL